MNEPHFEVFPETREGVVGGVTMPEGATVQPVLTGNFVWHFQTANGDITFTGGESFTRREDAHRSIHGAGADVLTLILGGIYIGHAALVGKLPIVDLDENGKEIPTP